MGIDSNTKLKVGDILINRFAGYLDCRYFIYLGSNGKYIYGIEFVKGRKHKTSYYKKTLKEITFDGKPAFEIVGHSDFLDVAKSDLDKAKSMEGILYER